MWPVENECHLCKGPLIGELATRSAKLIMMSQVITGNNDIPNLLEGQYIGVSKRISSSPEPSGSQGELIVYPYSGVRCRRRQQCLNIFSSETALPIKAKFYVEPPWEGGTKVYTKGPGPMTKMAAMPICGKNL